MKTILSIFIIGLLTLSCSHIMKYTGPVLDNEDELRRVYCEGNWLDCGVITGDNRLACSIRELVCEGVGYEGD